MKRKSQWIGRSLSATYWWNAVRRRNEKAGPIRGLWVVREALPLFALPASLCFLTLAGCHSPTIPDPNDPAVPGLSQIQVVENNLHWASDAANRRVLKGEINPAQAQALVSQYAKSLCSHFDPDTISPDDAFQCGNVFLAAQDWEGAKKVLAKAVDYAEKTGNVDHLVNSKLWLAQAEAELGEVEEAISLAKSTFAVADYQKAPILPAVLLNIVPAATGKGHDVELARLLLGAIFQHEHVLIDPKSTAGKMFLLAQPAHVTHAWDLAQVLFIRGGRPDLARQAAQMAARDPLYRGNAI